MAWKNKRKAPHHMGTFHVASQRCRDMAYANSSTRCRRCGRTLAEVRRVKPRAKWTAGHLVDGQIDGPLAPECSPCSVRSGGQLGRERAAAKQIRRTEHTW